MTNRMFLAEWFMAVPSCMGACAVFALNHEFLAVRREIKNGAYSPWAYLIGNAVFQVGRPGRRAGPGDPGALGRETRTRSAGRLGRARPGDSDALGRETRTRSAGRPGRGSPSRPCAVTE